MYMRCLYVLHNVCGKVLVMCGKVCVLMCLGVVIFACIVSPLRENVNTPDVSPVRISKKTHTDLINTRQQVDRISLVFYNNQVSLTGVSPMSVVISQAQKQRYRITLELETLEDFNPHQIDWESMFQLEGSERLIDSYVEDLSVPVRW